MKNLITIISSAIISFVPNVAIAQSPAMSNNWEDISMTEEACINTAKRAMTQAGFSEGLEAVGQSVFSGYGSYTSVARCVPENNIVFFAVAGPNSDACTEFVNRIREEFATLKK